MTKLNHNHIRNLIHTCLIDYFNITWLSGPDQLAVYFSLNGVDGKFKVKQEAIEGDISFDIMWGITFCEEWTTLCAVLELYLESKANTSKHEITEHSLVIKPKDEEVSRKLLESEGKKS